MAANDQKQENDNDKTPPTPMAEETPVVTQHILTIGKKKLAYTATTGRMPLKDEEKGEIVAQIFFTAYTLDGVDDPAQRPLIFVFNGGPGSSSIWLHMGAVGPKRVKMLDEGFLPPPPYELEDNAHAWLDLADLVFIDPVGTGYSRAKDEETAKKYWNLKADLESVGEFIRLYLVRYGRWASPLFLAGESYGTTRSAGLAGLLVNKGIAFNGIILISTVLNFQTLTFTRSNDLPFWLFLPTYTASAWYHGRLAADLQARPLVDVLAEAAAWAETDYLVALAKGDRLTPEEREITIEQVARYTGLSPRFIDHSNLRINIFRFCKELLRDEKRTVGRLDSRFKGIDTLAVTEFPDFDPSLLSITPPYTAMLNNYVRQKLGYESDLEYETLSFDVNQKWEWERGQFPDTGEALREALAKNPYLKVFVAQGYYDLATPHFAAEYTFNHMDIDPELHGNIGFYYYQAGHMVYLDIRELAKLKADVSGFVAKALGK